VTDLATLRRPQATGFAHAVRREVVVEHEALAALFQHQINDLFILASGSEGAGADALRLAAGEQRRAVDARQHADLDADGAHFIGSAAVHARAARQRLQANVLFEHVVEQALESLRELVLLVLGEPLRFGLLRNKLLNRRIADLIGQVLAPDLRHGLPEPLQLRAERLLQLALEALQRRVNVGDRNLRLRPGLLGELALEAHEALNLLVADLDGFQYFGFRHLIHLALDHRHRLFGAGDDDVHGAGFQLLVGRVDNQFVVHKSDANAGDRPLEGNGAERERGRRTQHRCHLRGVIPIGGQDSQDDVDALLVLVWEERADRPVDHAGVQDGFLGRLPFALEEATGNFSTCVELLFVVNGQRKERQWFIERIAIGGGEHARVAEADDDGAVGLPSQAPGFERKISFNELDNGEISHVYSLTSYGYGWTAPLHTQAVCNWNGLNREFRACRPAGGTRPGPRDAGSSSSACGARPSS